MIDAIGQEIKEGWAAIADPQRGSISARKVYVIGTKGTTTVRYIARYSWSITSPEAYNEYKTNPEGFPEDKVQTKVATRVIMLGEQND